MSGLELYSALFANFVWGKPLLVLLVGGGAFFAIYSRFLPYRHLVHAVGIMLGRYDTPGDYTVDLTVTYPAWAVTRKDQLQFTVADVP